MESRNALASDFVLKCPVALCGDGHHASSWPGTDPLGSLRTLPKCRRLGVTPLHRPRTGLGLRPCQPPPLDECEGERRWSGSHPELQATQMAPQVTGWRYGHDGPNVLAQLAALRARRSGPPDRSG